MASSRKYNTFVIGFPEAINNCPRIIVCSETEVGNITLFEASNITSEIISGKLPGLIISRDEDGSFHYRKDDLFWLLPDEYEFPNPESEEWKAERYRKRKEWGFNYIIYLSSNDDILGYTKFTYILKLLFISR